jgi:Methylamine utilization protein MauJ
VRFNEKLERPKPKDVFVGDLAVRGDWLVGNIAPNVSWPIQSQAVNFRGHKLFIMPVMEGYYPAIAMLMPSDMQRVEGQRLMLEFTSSLSWVKNRGISVESFAWGNLPRPYGNRTPHNFLMQEVFDLSYLPAPTDEREKLALALYREGMALNHAGYAFLAFYKIIEVAIPSADRAKWIGSNFGALRDGHARGVVESLLAKNIDIPKEIYASGRCAIAHASRLPIINPDNPDDIDRLTFELPLMKSLAAHAIETVLGIKSDQTNYKEHLYELAGFRKIFGKDIVQKIVAGESTDQLADVPHMTVTIAGKASYAPLANMEPTDLLLTGSTLLLILKSPHSAAAFRCELDFLAERLRFDIDRDLRIDQDDRTAKWAENIAELIRFRRDYYLNGRLQIFNSDTGDLISYLEPFMPLNVIVNAETFDREIEKWRTIARERITKAGDVP